MALEDITNKNFDEEIVLSVNPVIINLFTPIVQQSFENEEKLAEIAEEYSDVVKICRMNLDEQPKLTELFEVDRLPLMLMLDGGIIIKKIYDTPTKQEIIDEMELERIREFRKKGIWYKPKRNYIPNYIRNERW
ncbi:MAG: thioredoxin domain-containing protein [Anaerovoracaceae bacterium]|jgi:thioredoxin-like negative regulator of GroEL|nr:thioredoxin domain-containing protein [Bacillota bacterium]MDY2670744.1 thioredoxin domain-containing protein [Anaerovoracaceae bacterium]